MHFLPGFVGRLRVIDNLIFVSFIKLFIFAADITDFTETRQCHLKTT